MNPRHPILPTLPDVRHRRCACRALLGSLGLLQVRLDVVPAGWPKDGSNLPGFQTFSGGRTIRPSAGLPSEVSRQRRNVLLRKAPAHER